MAQEWTVIATVLLILFFLPAGAARPLAALESDAVSVVEGSLSGELVGAAWNLALAPSATVSSPGSRPLPEMAISAARAEITVYHAERYVAKDLEPPSPTRWSLTNVTSAGATSDASDARLVAVPAASEAWLILAKPAMRISPSESSAREFPTRVTRGPHTTFQTSSALQAAVHVEQLIELRGNLRLIVDGLDFRLESDQGPHELHTRRDVDGGEVHAMGASYAVHSTVHEAVLDLEDAVIRMPADEAYVASATLSSAGTWSFSHATGSFATVGEDKQVADDDVEVDGDLVGVLHRRGAVVQTALSGTVEGLVVNGRPASIAFPRESAVAPVPTLLAVLASTALVILLYFVAGSRRFRQLDQAMDRKEYAHALALSEGLRGHPRLAQDAALAAAICLLALGRAAEAHRRLLGRRQWAVHRRPTREFLLARAAAALGRREEAKASLARSLIAEPSLLLAAQADPLLAPILGEARPAGPAEAYT